MSTTLHSTARSGLDYLRSAEAVSKWLKRKRPRQLSSLVEAELVTILRLFDLVTCVEGDPVFRSSGFFERLTAVATIKRVMQIMMSGHIPLRREVVQFCRVHRDTILHLSRGVWIRSPSESVAEFRKFVDLMSALPRPSSRHGARESTKVRGGEDGSQDVLPAN